MLFLALTGLLACGKKPAPPTPPTAVNLITATAQTVLYYDKYPSTTVALSQVNLNAQVTGYITGIYFTEGTHVYKGQKLYSIDERLYQASVDQFKANLRVDSGNLQQVQQDADRYLYLKQNNAIASQVVDHALIALKNAKDSIRAAQQQLKTAETNLSYANIYAPFDGTIGISQVRLGNLVTPGSTILNTISTDNPMGVDFLINESQLPHFEDLQRNKQHSVDSLFTILLPNQQVYPYTGKLSVIDRAVDPQTGSIMIRLVFDNPQSVLRAGMSTVVRVHNQDATPQIVVPSRAVVEQMGEYFLFLAKDTVYNGGGGGAGGAQAADGQGEAKSGDKGDDKDAGKGDDKGGKGADTVQTPKLRAFQVKVQLGQTIGPNVVIKSGISEGDKVIVDGVQAIHEGSEITTSSRPAAGAAGGGRSGGGKNASAGN
jgi:membrane fusion protein (multidrug efflux system)